MGLFTQQLVPAYGNAAKVDSERLAGALSALDMQPIQLDNEVIRVDTDERLTLFYEFQGPENNFLLLHTVFHFYFSADQLTQMRDFCDESNSNSLWLKLYTATVEDGVFTLHADMTVDATHGLTDQQLDNVLHIFHTVSWMNHGRFADLFTPVT